MTGWTALIPGWLASAARLGRITGSLATTRYCLGSPPPARRPRPAATTIAATMPAMSVSKIGNATMALAVCAWARKPDLGDGPGTFHPVGKYCTAALAAGTVLSKLYAVGGGRLIRV